ncbi:EVE domain-containing protein [bacterium]|nr:EVE domain-containing protein [bacterium]
MAYWIIKQEPSTYCWDDLVADKKTAWDGVRNYQARNNIRLMKKGDTALLYHSGDEKRIVGVTRVVSEPYPDPTTTDDWSAVDVEPVFPLKEPVTLKTIKADKDLNEMALAKNSRLSVCPLSKAQYDKIVKMGGRGRI